MILVDTNVWSETTRPAPAPQVLTWLRAHQHEIAMASITVSELLTGVALMPAGVRQRQLEQALTSLIADAGRAILPFDQDAAVAHAGIVAHRRLIGRPAAVQDSMIAAIAKVHGAAVATRNTADFDQMGIELLDPWD